MLHRIPARRLVIALWALAFCTSHSGCRDAAPEERPLVVYAAMSLVDVLPPIAREWTAQGNPAVELDFASTSRLARQIEAGAPADALIAADATWPEALQRDGHLLGTWETPLARNELVVIVPDDAPWIPRTPAALASLPGKLAMGAPGVPVGRHALRALEEMNVPDDAWVAARIHGANARHVLRLVARGEVEAGIVYRTDALTSPDVQVAFALPHATTAPVIGYFPAITRQSTRQDEIRHLLAHLATPDVRGEFASRGFLPPAPGN